MKYERLGILISKLLINILIDSLLNSLVIYIYYSGVKFE